MISSAAVITLGGIILWSKPQASFDPSPFSKMMEEAVFPRKFTKNSMTHGMLTLKFSLENNYELIFALAYLNFSHLSGIEDFLKVFKNKFCSKFGDRLKNPVFASKINYIFDDEFDQIEKSFLSLSQTSLKVSKKEKIAQTKLEVPENSKEKVENRNEGSEYIKIKGKAKQENRSKVKNKKRSNLKEKRTWSNKKLSNSEKLALDFSKEKIGNKFNGGKTELGKEKIKKGEANLDSSEDDSPNIKPENKSAPNFLASVLEKISSKTLNIENLSRALSAVEKNLIDKNVAVEVAKEVCESVRNSLEGKVVSKISSLSALVNRELEKSFERILYPQNSPHILKKISVCKQHKKPCSIAFVGVNGVGKSTSLSKVAFYLSKRNLKVSLVACDTFRSGAVEQLLTHASALRLRIFSKGYAKDSSQVCKEGLKEAIKQKDDVVLVDTAGRMQNNEPLMRSLKKLVDQNRPDLVLFVGEALVGNEALNQLKKFAEHVKIDGIILTKCDTVDKKIGAAISMAYKARVPVVFMGTGQNYGDLKRTDAKLLTRMLLQ